MIAGLQADAREEYGEAEIAEELVGGDGHIPDDRSDVAELGEGDGGEERPASEADAQRGVQAGEFKGNASDEDAEDDAEEDGDEAGPVECFGAVAEFRFGHSESRFGADDGELIGKGEAEGCGGGEIDAGAVYAADGDAGASHEVEFAERSAENLRAGDDQVHASDGALTVPRSTVLGRPMAATSSDSCSRWPTAR